MRHLPETRVASVTNHEPGFAFGRSGSRIGSTNHYPKSHLVDALSLLW
jgi:hypothetical protein